MMTTPNVSRQIALAITKAASKQTFHTIQFLVDRDRVEDAYRAYAYFRWVDDRLDSDLAPSRARERLRFIERQKSVMEKCQRGESVPDATAEENMLIELVKHDHEKNSGLESYLGNMMQVMEFDARRRGRLISYSELSQYTRWLATAVTEAMHYFIGHCCYSPHDEARYLAVSGAHITHMLRDTCEDVQAGYFNIPREIIESTYIQPQEIQSKAYRAWVEARVQLARQCFQAGKEYLARVENPRCRLAGFAYTARFEWILDTIEREKYFLRAEYSERKSLRTGAQMFLSILSSLIQLQRKDASLGPVITQSLRKP